MRLRTIGFASLALAVAIAIAQTLLPCETWQRPLGGVLTAWCLAVLAIVGNDAAARRFGEGAQSFAIWLAASGVISGGLALVGFFC